MAPVRARPETLHEGHRPGFLLRAEAGQVRITRLASTTAEAHLQSSPHASRHHPCSRLSRRTFTSVSCVACAVDVARIQRAPSRHSSAPAKWTRRKHLGTCTLRRVSISQDRLHPPLLPVLQHGSGDRTWPVGDAEPRHQRAPMCWQCQIQSGRPNPTSLHIGVAAPTSLVEPPSKRRPCQCLCVPCCLLQICFTSQQRAAHSQGGALALTKAEGATPVTLIDVSTHAIATATTNTPCLLFRHHFYPCLHLCQWRQGRKHCF